MIASGSKTTTLTIFRIMASHQLRKPWKCCSAGRSVAVLFGVAIEPLAHFLTGLEERHALLVDRHVFTGARIATGARWAILHGKCAEAAQFDAIAACQRGDDLVENGVDDVLDIPLVEMRAVLSDALDKLGFDHRNATLPVNESIS